MSHYDSQQALWLQTRLPWGTIPNAHANFHVQAHLITDHPYLDYITHVHTLYKLFTLTQCVPLSTDCSPGIVSLIIVIALLVLIFVSFPDYQF